MRISRITVVSIGIAALLSTVGCGKKTVKMKDPKKVEMIDTYDKLRADPLKALSKRHTGAPQREPIRGQEASPAP